MKVIFKTIKLEKLRFFRGVLRLYLRLMAALNERPMTEKKQYWKRDVVLSFTPRSLFSKMFHDK